MCPEGALHAFRRRQYDKLLDMNVGSAQGVRPAKGRLHALSFFKREIFEIRTSTISSPGVRERHWVGAACAPFRTLGLSPAWVRGLRKAPRISLSCSSNAKRHAYNGREGEREGLGLAPPRIAGGPMGQGRTTQEIHSSGLPAENSHPILRLGNRPNLHP